MSPEELLDTALAAVPDSAERILYGIAAFSALVDGDLILVGGGAQVTHTGVGRLTDIDVTGNLTSADKDRLADAGFTKDGRHWIFEDDRGVLAVEIPSSTMDGAEPPERVDVEGVPVWVISVTDLMMDRLVQATDGTPVTRDEALQLAVAAHESIGWEQLRERADAVAAAEPFLKDLPRLVEEFDSEGARHAGGGSQEA